MGPRHRRRRAQADPARPVAGDPDTSAGGPEHPLLDHRPGPVRGAPRPGRARTEPVPPPRDVPSAPDGRAQQQLRAGLGNRAPRLVQGHRAGTQRVDRPELRDLSRGSGRRLRHLRDDQRRRRRGRRDMRVDPRLDRRPIPARAADRRRQPGHEARAGSPRRTPRKPHSGSVQLRGSARSGSITRPPKRRSGSTA